MKENTLPFHFISFIYLTDKLDTYKNTCKIHRGVFRHTFARQHFSFFFSQSPTHKLSKSNICFSPILNVLHFSEQWKTSCREPFVHPKRINLSKNRAVDGECPAHLGVPANFCLPPPTAPFPKRKLEPSVSTRQIRTKERRISFLEYFNLTRVEYRATSKSTARQQGFPFQNQLAPQEFASLGVRVRQLICDLYTAISFAQYENTLSFMGILFCKQKKN